MTLQSISDKQYEAIFSQFDSVTSREVSPSRNSSVGPRTPEKGGDGVSKKSSVKASLQRMFNSKRRENFSKNATPNRQNKSGVGSAASSPDRDRRSKLSKLLGHQSTKMNHKKIEKYLRFEHSLYQISRIFIGASKRQLIHSFEHLRLFGLAPAHLDESQIIMKNVFQAADKNIRRHLADYLNKWRKAIKQKPTAGGRVLMKIVTDLVHDNLRAGFRSILNCKDRFAHPSVVEEKVESSIYLGAFKLFSVLESRYHECQTTFLRNLSNFSAAISEKYIRIENGTNQLVGFFMRQGMGELRKWNKKSADRETGIKLLFSWLSLQLAKTKCSAFHKMMPELRPQVAVDNEKLHACGVLVISNIIKRVVLAQMSQSFAILKENEPDADSLSESEEPVRLSLVIAATNVLAPIFQRRKYLSFYEIKQAISLKTNSLNQLQAALSRLTQRIQLNAFLKLQEHGKLLKLSAQMASEMTNFQQKIQQERENYSKLTDRVAIIIMKNFFRILSNYAENTNCRALNESFNTLFRHMQQRREHEAYTRELQNYKAESGRIMLKTLEKVFDIHHIKEKSFVWSRLKSNAKIRAQQKLALLLKCNLMESTLNKIISKKRTVWLHQSLQAMIVLQHQQAFFVNQRLTKLMNFIRKCYLTKLRSGFSIWKMDLDICKVEWLIVKNLVQAKKIEDDQTLKEISELLRQVIASFLYE